MNGGSPSQGARAAAGAPAVSVVVVARGEPAGLARQLAALRAQTLAAEAFEVVVVEAATDAGAAAPVVAAKEDWAALRLVRGEPACGEAAARNAGRLAAAAPLVAFTDDRCQASPGWLAAGLSAARAHPDAFVQGPTVPHPDERERLGPLSHALDRTSLGPWFEPVNIFYPRELLERAGGFDEEGYTNLGLDGTDLAWKAVELGATPVWAENAVMYHAVAELGPVEDLRSAWRSEEIVLALKRHPELRRRCAGRVFGSQSHFWLARAAVAMLLPARWRWLRWWLAAPYLARVLPARQSAAWAPYILLHDLVEAAAHARGRVRHRLPLL